MHRIANFFADTPVRILPSVESAANENTHKPCVQKRHDNMKARSQWRTQAASYTAQDKTEHESMQLIKTWTACNNTRELEKHVAEHEPRWECQGSLAQSDRTLTITLW